MSAVGNSVSPLLQPAQLGQLQQAVADLEHDQLVWASGYLAGKQPIRR